MDDDEEISLYASYKCIERCPASNRSIIDLECDHICYKGCEASCLDDYDPIFQFEIKAETIIFTIGNTVSMMGLLITLITLCVFSKLRTVSGRCLMNMVASLFLAKFSFQVNPVFTDTSRKWCSAMAVAQHYFCLVAFHWVSVLAFDLYITIKKGRRPEEIPKQADQNKKKKSQHPTFLGYFVFSWGFPWSAIFACVTVESLSHSEFHYGNPHHCGVFGDEALLYSLAIPLLVITTVNIGLFILICCHPGLQKQIKLCKVKKYNFANNKYLQQIKTETARNNMGNINSNIASAQNTENNGVLQAQVSNSIEPSGFSISETENTAVDIHFDPHASYQLQDNAQQNTNQEMKNQTNIESSDEQEQQSNSNGEDIPSTDAQSTNFTDITLEVESESSTSPTTETAACTDQDLMKLYRAQMHELALLRIYVNMSFLMALAWLSGFLAAFLHYYEIWMLFILFNTLQGIFIFKSFVLNVAVREMWLEAVKVCMYGGATREDEDQYVNDERSKLKSRGKYLVRNLPKRIIGIWPIVAASRGKQDTQPIYDDNLADNNLEL